MDHDDELLAIRCQLGEREALDELVARWHAPLWHYARRLTGNDADAADVTQDVWLRVLRGLPRLREPARLRAWVFGIARRALMDRFREAYAAPAMVEQAIDHLPAEPAPARDEIAAMQVHLAMLPFPEREALALFYLDELTLADMARVLSVPLGTVKSRLHRARRLLRERMLAAEGGRS